MEVFDRQMGMAGGEWGKEQSLEWGREVGVR